MSVVIDLGHFRKQKQSGWIEAYPEWAEAWKRLTDAQESGGLDACVDLACSTLDRNLLGLLGLIPTPDHIPEFPRTEDVQEALDRAKARFKSLDFPRMFVGGKKGKLSNRRKAWRAINAALSDGSDLEGMADLAYKVGFQDTLLMLGSESSYGGPLLPLAPEERLEAIRIIRSRQLSPGKSQAARKLEEKERLAESRREKRRDTREKKRLYDAERLEEIAALTPGRRAIAILKDEAYWRARWLDLQPDWQRAAEVLKAKRVAQQAERDRVKEEKRRAAEAEHAERMLATPVPASSVLQIEEEPGAIRIKFVPDQSLSRGSPSIANDVLYVVRSALRSARLKPADGHSDSELSRWNASTLEFLCHRTEVEKLISAVAEAEAALARFGERTLTPTQVEEMLKITKNERVKWTKNGRLNPCGHDSFRKWGRTLTYPLFRHGAIAAISPELIDQWRGRDKKRERENRQKAAVQAVETRKVNDQARRAVRDQITELARECAREEGDLELVPIIRLAVMTQMASRWAKEYQVRKNLERKNEFYAIKDQALRIIAQASIADISFVPSDRDRLNVHLCGHHRNEWRDYRGWSGNDFYGWAHESLDDLKKCSGCHVSVDKDYFSLYSIALKAGSFCASFHIPYDLGKSFLPARHELPSCPVRTEDYHGDSVFRFGRPINDDEMVLWPADKLIKEISKLMKLWDPAETEKT